jgi:hypothetical protein
MAVELSVLEISGITAGGALGILLGLFLFGPEHLRQRAGNAINVILSCLGREQIKDLNNTSDSGSGSGSESGSGTQHVTQTEKTNSIKMCGIKLFECIEELNCIDGPEQQI